ncbi:HlyD family efflux transporter periplasmic adaptor subunit [Caulobacter sp. UNC279MFTsu5.1]|uniref:HlyD family secretion protein n=1 Tax=Caulobacter sp. UNC279MFTsu5.1 TaxID=1502775 RepID=UPI0008F006C1|nr:HlyD family efflux transporter periplasmic adaptor subunit [Caulobacter sp. UNC279MFTsu5.1]SFK30511.1 membrane fusion protein, multidrug efflux system [Caulobacter sp. UNC279MFTsu5.1]
MADTTASPAQFAAKPKASRRQLLTGLAGVVVVGVAAWGLYQVLVGSHHVETDNAYVGAEVAQVTPLVSGPVAKVLVSETQTVTAGQPLVVLDDADAKIAVLAAQAALGQAQRKVQGYFASDDALAGQVAARDADIARAAAAVTGAQASLEQARVELSRRKALADSGAVSGEELTTAQSQFTNAQSALVEARAALAQAKATRAAAEGSREVNTALISGLPASKNPEIAAAEARLASAQLALDRTVLRAPLAGVVSKKNVQVGQQVQVGAPLMAVVPTTDAFVDANFKEVQLDKVRIGQPVVLTSDLYGGGVKFHGRVKGLSGGTGSAFSLIPAQNASGNWIKVVQRLPVRIALDPAELKDHPLRVGLSMKAAIDISK